MKAIAVFPKSKQVRLIDAPEPLLASPTQVKARILEVGVCGTDREICAFEYGTPPASAEHLIIGHESLAEVIEVGASVTRVRPGDLVVPMVRRPCEHDHCLACNAERQDFCYTGEFSERGIKGHDGFMTELIVEDERYLNVVPRALRDVAILVEPLTIAEKALEQIWQVQQRLPWACALTPSAPSAGDASPSGARGGCRRALVLGAGPVGLLGAMALRASGFQTHVYSREPAPNPKADIVTAIGARYLCAGEVPVADLSEVVGDIDVVYEATGASKLCFEVMAELGPNAIFVFTGVPGRKGAVEVDTDLLMRNLVLRNQVVFGTVNAGRHAFEAAIRDLATFRARWPAAVRALITARHAPEAFLDLLQGPATGIKNVICFARANGNGSSM